LQSLTPPPLAFVLEGETAFSSWPATSVWTALYLAAAGTVAAFFLYNWLLQRIPVTRVQLQVFLSTVLAVLLGVVVLDEQLEWQTALGSLVAVLTVVLTVGLPWRPRALRGAERKRQDLTPRTPPALTLRLPVQYPKDDGSQASAPESDYQRPANDAETLTDPSQCRWLHVPGKQQANRCEHNVLR